MSKILGLDLGQAKDFTALVVRERLTKPTGKLLRNAKMEMLDLYHLRHLERFHLGTSYPTVVEKVQALMATKEMAGKTFLVADATGVGRPVIDLLRASGLNSTAVTITGGAQTLCDLVTGYWSIPKRDLVSSVAVLLQSDRLKFSDALPKVKILADELPRFEVKITDAGNDTYGAWREGAHDELVLATALGAGWASGARN